MFSITRQEARIHGLHTRLHRWEYSSLAKCPLPPLPHPLPVTGDDRVESLKRGGKKKRKKREGRKEEKKKKEEGGGKNDAFSSTLTPVTLNWPRVARGGSGGTEATRVFERRWQDRFTRPSIKKKLAQKRAEKSNPRNVTQLWNRSTKPFDASVRVAITRNKTETGSSFLLSSSSLSPFNRSFLFSLSLLLSWSSPSTRVPLPGYSPADKTVSKICVRKYALNSRPFRFVRSKGELRGRNFNGRSAQEWRVHTHETR